MAQIRAHQLRPASLATTPIGSVCKDFVDGFCRQGDRCTSSHEIRMIEDDAQSSGLDLTNSAPNYLSSSPRVIPADKRVFDEDGPGDLSRHGTRHDNDHVDIRRIRILPTTDEILCLRRPYMPCKDFAHSHFLPRGYSCLVDTLFRQLRYESTECIIDACYHAAQQLAMTSSTEQYHDYDFSQETPRGVRYSLFHDVLLEELLFHETKGTVVRLSFACPCTLRGGRMHSSGLFESGMLVVLLGLDEDGSSLSTTFFEVHLRQSTDSMKVRSGNDLRGKFHSLPVAFSSLTRNSVGSALSRRAGRHRCAATNCLLRARLTSRNIPTAGAPWGLITWLFAVPPTAPESVRLHRCGLFILCCLRNSAVGVRDWSTNLCIWAGLQVQYRYTSSPEQANINKCTYSGTLPKLSRVLSPEA